MGSRERGQQQSTRSVTFRSWVLMVVLVVAYVPMNFLLPCACVLGRYDPRPKMLLLIAGIWIVHLVCCTWEKRYSDLRRGAAVGLFFFVIAVLTMPM